MSIQEIQAEREAQKATWGAEADDKWTPAQWAAVICRYATRLQYGDLNQVDPAKVRADMVKVGALALACIESFDRKGA